MWQRDSRRCNATNNFKQMPQKNRYKLEIGKSSGILIGFSRFTEGLPGKRLYSADD